MAAPPCNDDDAAASRAGLAAAIGSFTIWGGLPLYLKALAQVPAVEIMAHRIVWCCVAVFAWLALRGEAGAVRAALFAFGARRIPLSTIGLVQYIAPTLQFLSGVWLFHESFSAQRGIGFLFIWTALAFYAGDGLWRSRRQFACFRR